MNEYYKNITSIRNVKDMHPGRHNKEDPSKNSRNAGNKITSSPSMSKVNDSIGAGENHESEGNAGLAHSDTKQSDSKHSVAGGTYNLIIKNDKGENIDQLVLGESPEKNNLTPTNYLSRI